MSIGSILLGWLSAAEWVLTFLRVAAADLPWTSGSIAAEAYIATAAQSFAVKISIVVVSKRYLGGAFVQSAKSVQRASFG